MFHVKQREAMTIHPSYALRASFTAHDQHTAKVHAFDGVRGACGRTPEKSAWAHSALVFHPPATRPTCRGCRNRGVCPAHYSSPELQHRAAAHLTTYALAHRDPDVLAVALRLLSARAELEPYAHLIAECST